MKKYKRVTPDNLQHEYAVLRTLNLGDVVDYCGVRLMAVLPVPRGVCNGCYFRGALGAYGAACPVLGTCTAVHRPDGETVVFVPVEDL